MADDDAGPEMAGPPGMIMMCQPMMPKMMEMMGRGGMMGKGKMGMMGADKAGDMMGGQMMSGGMKRQAHASMAHAGFPKLLSADAVKSRFEDMIKDNKRLKVAKVDAGGDFTFTVEITTVEGSLVHKLLVDRRDGGAYETD
jgi:hypothetical protein